MDPPVKGLEVKDALELAADAGELLVRLESLVRLVVLENVRLDEEDPSLSGIGGGEHGLPLAHGGEGVAVTGGLEGIVAEEAELDVVAEELVDLFDGLAF